MSKVTFRDVLVVGFISCGGLVACNGGSNSGATAAPPQGDTAPPTVTPAPPPSSGSPGGSSGSSSGAGDLGATCTGVSGQLCLGLNYYVFDDANGDPIIDEATAVSNVQAANAIWAQCKIAFQMELYQNVEASSLGVSTTSLSVSDEETILNAFASSTDLVVVSYSGSVPSGADAWTFVGGPYGSILDLATDNYPPILAHELGHDLDLADNSDTSNLMDLVVYASPDTLTSDQCATAVSAAQSQWAATLR